jgi:hypothetical protein
MPDARVILFHVPMRLQVADINAPFDGHQRIVPNLVSPDYDQPHAKCKRPSCAAVANPSAFGALLNLSKG